MSLSSFLLKSTGKVDTELDALFQTKPPPAPRSVSIPKPTRSPIRPLKSDDIPRKRKLNSQQLNAPQKRQKTAPKDTKALKQTSNIKAVVSEEDDQGETSDLEVDHPQSEATDDELEKANSNGAEEDSDVPSKLVHESLAGERKSRSKSKANKKKYVPADETPAQRDRRTIFIGNLSLEVAQQRPLQKQLQRHILSFIPTAKIESIRFRSIPFSSPSTTVESTAVDSTSTSSHKNPSQRAHSLSRASTWRSTTNDSTTEQGPDKAYLTPNQKKKMLFLTHQLHTSGTTVHAYIVFAHPLPSTTPRPSNLPPLEKVLDPYEAAKEAVKKADGSFFQERAIRVDFVGKDKSSGAVGGDAGGVNGDRAFQDADPKTTLFVGNLDLGGQEEDLRAFFEKLMKTERGDPPVHDDEGENKVPRAWVTRVRIIRDKNTQLGKGFGYVQFTDRECVDEILTFEPSQLKFAKRKLRVQRCKTIPGTKLPSSLKSQLSSDNHPKSKPKSEQNASSPSKPTKSQSHSQQRAPPTPIVIPKGDPLLGNKLASLSKQERKAAKAADADRVARRLAKKKARMSMGTSKDHAIQSEGGEKKRERVRKVSSKRVLGGGGTTKKGKSEGRNKGRVRSDKSLEKRNLKK